MADVHKVFTVEHDRLTLIVAPRGDAIAFRESDVQGELETLCQLTQKADVQNLIIDWGSSNYFGTTMIGALVGVARKITEAGGRAVMCNASPQMQSVLKVMNLDKLWPLFDTLKAAKAFCRKVTT